MIMKVIEIFCQMIEGVYKSILLHNNYSSNNSEK